MNWKPGWLLLLSISAGVWSVPIERNAAQQGPKEEVQEENMVTSHYSLICCFFLTCFYGQRLTSPLQHCAAGHWPVLRQVPQRGD